MFGLTGFIVLNQGRKDFRMSWMVGLMGFIVLNQERKDFRIGRIGKKDTLDPDYPCILPFLVQDNFYSFSGLEHFLP